MTGWNLPPGCNVSDIPGNRPIDEFYDNFCANCTITVCPCELADETIDYDSCPRDINAAWENRNKGDEDDI
jgi:hypothetical protein